MNKLRSNLKLFSIGGIAYGAVEILWRKRTHWSMLITGGVCFLALFKIFTKRDKMPILCKCCLGSCIITAAEFLCGCIVNIKMKLNVWDYSRLKFNVLGQICPLYSMLWGLLCLPVNTICKKIKENSRTL